MPRYKLEPWSPPAGNTRDTQDQVLDDMVDRAARRFAAHFDVSVLTAAQRSAMRELARAIMEELVFGPLEDELQ